MGEYSFSIWSLQGAGEIFNHLVDYIAYPPERVASAYELIGNYTKTYSEYKNLLFLSPL